MNTEVNNKSVNKVLTIEKAKKILGSRSNKYSDQELTLLLEKVCGLAEIVYEIYEGDLNKES